MPIDNYPLIGAMDQDSPDVVMQRGFHKTARNGIFRGDKGRMRFESALGTTLISNPNLPGSGTNKTIGTFYDQVNHQLFVFNYNSGGTHGIYIYSTQTGVWQTLIQTGTNTVGDPLGFTASGRIQGVEIIYGDTNSGNLLFFLDSLGRPTKINVQRYLSGVYTAIDRSYINVIKAPPVAVPRVCYENDYTVTSNNLLNSLFQFAYTFIYDDLEESVISSASIVPLPGVPFSTTTATPVYQSSRIGVYLQTGSPTVTKIRLYMRYTQNGAQTGWFIVDTLNKSSLGIGNNGIYKYLFYNAGNYPPADPSFTVLNYDYVPQKANAQSLLAGTTISYGGITEGYPYIPSTFSKNLIGTNLIDNNYIQNGVLFFADYNGTFTGSQPNVEFFLTGEAANDGSGNPKTLQTSPVNFYVLAKSNGSSINFSYANFAHSYDVPTLLSAIASAAVSAGWVLVTTKPNSIVMYYPTGTVVFNATRLENRYLAVNTTNYQFAFYPESNYSYGIVYYDSNGVTNGVITDVTANISTLPYNQLGYVTVTQIQLTLTGIVPPAWATYYHIVRTNSLTYNKHLYWISNQAFSNVNQLVQSQYAYIGISNIADYNLQISATQNVVGYQFAQGDRIRIMGIYHVDGTFVPLSYDYAILGTEVNPVINGTPQAGTFIKIAYPTADIAANPVNYKFDGSDDFQNYQILLYSVANNSGVVNAGSTAGEANVYYETGHSFPIGNPGTNLAYHMGNLSDNNIIFSDGDIFARTRTIQTGNTYYLQVGYFYFPNPNQTAYIPAPSVTNTSYTLGAQGSGSASLNGAVYPQLGTSGGLFQNTSANTLTLRLRGTWVVTADHQTYLTVNAKICTGPTTATVIPLIVQSPYIPVLPTGELEIILDATFGVPPGAKVWLIFGNGNSVSNLQSNAFTLRLDVLKNYTIPIFESSFSDVYSLITNANNRPNLQNTSALTSYFSTLFRFSEPYQLGTNINNTNRFYPNNFDEFDKSYGAIIRMRARQKELRIFQQRRCGRVGVYANFIKDNQGANTLVTTDNIITQNNVQYFEGEFGIGNQPDSLCSSGFADYFVDPVKGYILRLSLDGITAISMLYKIQTFTGANLPLYLNNYVYPFGGNSVIVAAFNFAKDRDGEAIFCFQGGTGGTLPLPNQSIAFDEAKNAWTSFYDFAPDAIVCCENIIYSLYNGQLYSHTNNTNYCNFYGTQYVPSITLVKNDLPLVNKTWRGISEVSNVIWNAPLIQTEMYSYGSTRQQSNLVDSDFNLMEGKYHAPILRDINSIGGIGNGDPLKGTYLVVQLQPTNGANFAHIADAAVKYDVATVVEK